MIVKKGRSAFTAAVLAMDANVHLLPDEEAINLGNLLLMPSQKLGSKIVTNITIPLNIKLAYEDVSRTPADLPIVNASVAVWPGGRTRVILGGFGEMPILASDGPERGGEEDAARDALSQAGDDWASAEYRMEIAPVLVNRCIARIDA